MRSLQRGLEALDLMRGADSPTRFPGTEANQIDRPIAPPPPEGRRPILRPQLAARLTNSARSSVAVRTDRRPRRTASRPARLHGSSWPGEYDPRPEVAMGKFFVDVVIRWLMIKMQQNVCQAAEKPGSRARRMFSGSGSPSKPVGLLGWSLTHRERRRRCPRARSALAQAKAESGQGGRRFDRSRRRPPRGRSRRPTKPSCDRLHATRSASPRRTSRPR